MVCLLKHYFAPGELVYGLCSRQSEMDVSTQRFTVSSLIATPITLTALQEWGKIQIKQSKVCVDFSPACTPEAYPVYLLYSVLLLPDMFTQLLFSLFYDDSGYLEGDTFVL